MGGGWPGQAALPGPAHARHPNLCSRKTPAKHSIRAHHTWVAALLAALRAAVARTAAGIPAEGAPASLAGADQALHATGAGDTQLLACSVPPSQLAPPQQRPGRRRTAAGAHADGGREASGGRGRPTLPGGQNGTHFPSLSSKSPLHLPWDRGIGGSVRKVSGGERGGGGGGQSAGLSVMLPASEGRMQRKPSQRQQRQQQDQARLDCGHAAGRPAHHLHTPRLSQYPQPAVGHMQSVGSDVGHVLAHMSSTRQQEMRPSWCQLPFIPCSLPERLFTRRAHSPPPPPPPPPPRYHHRHALRLTWSTLVWR